MDTLIKVICKKETCINSKSMNKKQIKELIIDEKYADGNLGNEFLIFKEYERVEIELVSNDFNTTIEIESYNTEKNTVIKEGKTEIISLGGESDNMLLPGYYSIKIKTSKLNYKGFYKVIPSSIEWNSLLNIREYLENIINGLSYNIYSERKGHCGYNTDNIFMLELYKYIKDNKDKLFINLNSIVNNPIIDIYKKYNLKPSSKIIDNKSQRWLAKKGQFYNNNIYMPNFFYEKHSELTHDTSENQFIKKILEYIYDRLNELSKYYSNLYNNLDTKLSKINKEISDRETKKNYYENNNIFGIDRTKKDNEFKLKILYERQKEQIKKKEVINSNLLEIKKIKNLLSHYKNESWLQNINSDNNIFKPTTRLLKDKYYNEVYELYRNLNNLNKDGNQNNFFPFKNTSKLFEIYCYIIIKEILEELGFQWIEGWLKNSDNILAYNGELDSNETITLIKDNYKIELEYDKEVMKYNNKEDITTSQFILPGNGTSTRPDITLKLYKDNKVISCFIAEVKCRKKYYIYNKKEETDVIKQISDYNNFQYYDIEEEKLFRCLDKIVVLYPKQNGKCKFKHQLYNFFFIQIDPTNLDDKPYGYEELKEELEDFLNTNGAL